LRLSSGNIFQMASCSATDTRQQFTAIGKTSGGSLATSITGFNGTAAKTLCYTATDKVEAYDNTCLYDYKTIDMEVASTNCFRLKWGSTQALALRTPATTGDALASDDLPRVTTPVCMAPPTAGGDAAGDQDAYAKSEYCSPPAFGSSDPDLGLWIRFDQDATKTTCA